MTTNQSLQFSELTLEKVVFEFRYPQALLLWDRHGAVWQSIGNVRPALRILQAEPGRTVFQIDENYEAIIELCQSNSIVHAPNKLMPDFQKLSTTVFENVVEILEVSSLVRVGTRFFFVKEYDDRKSASEAFFSTGLVCAPKAPQFGVAGDQIEPSFGIRYEDEKKGVSVRARVEKQRIEFKPPLGVKDPPPFQKESARFVLDVDIYTLVPMDVGQMNTCEWLSQAEHVVRRDGDKLLRGSR